MPLDPRDPVFTRSPSSGPCFLYVAPSAYEDLAKLGFSRDPLVRLQSLHPRWFEVFDLDRALLVETETVRDARRIELKLRRQLALHNAPAPLTVRQQAGGHTEWYRGAYEQLRDAVISLGSSGHVVHAPARRWFGRMLGGRSDQLYSWSEALLTPDELDGLVGNTPGQRTVRDVLDAFTALSIEVEPLLPERVWRWYRGFG